MLEKLSALSLRQPWAWMVVHGGKSIENRRWDTRFRGEFFVHAAKGMTRDEYAEAVAFAFDAEPDLVVPDPEVLLRGGIIGRARLVDVIRPCESTGAADNVSCAHKWHMPEQFGFVLEGIEALPFRALRGALGFFNVEGP